MQTITRRQIRLIVNPNAGRGARRRARINRFREALRREGCEVELTPTLGPRDAARLAGEAAARGGAEIVVAGGDGTVNEALQGVVGTDARLGVFPAGTANVLARELSLPFDPGRAAALVARGETRKLYAGCATDGRMGEPRYFLLMAGVGLDASVVEGVRPRLKRRLGEGAFWLSGLSHLASWVPVPFEVRAAGETLPATFAAVGKGARYGGNLSVTPRARLDAPEFEVCVVNSASRLRFLRLLGSVMRGGVGSETPGVRFVRATRVEVARPAGAGEDALVQADGEIIGRLPMTFEIVQTPVEVFVPPADGDLRTDGYYRPK
jgi:YegS/Rv2252/BmrU family lipid kinase